MLRDRLRNVLDAPAFERAIVGLILLNALTLGLETSASVNAAIGPMLFALDRAILAVFVVELALRLYVRRLAFFNDPWRIFDLVVVGVALVPASGPLSILRAFRILRVLRMVSVVPSMRRVVTGLLRAIPGMGSVVLLMSLIFYVFSVMATKLFGAAHPEWFGDLGESAYTLFQVMTLESWSMGIVRPVMEAYPQAWLFFVPFILITTFAVLNLFVGIMVDAMQSHHEAGEEADVAAAASKAAATDERAEILAELRALRAEVAALRAERNEGA
ncbi:voltage-gated sodium channel [Albimonas donghaensis]|uniref:Voltage-gated sodium channel n=1 Tax=Albimonas donghaensis TaxID=356660 RepID=A0A1H3CKE6_9RHOB|nr:ion transporter [Albimonas donghaensis]SDX53929.1 voltage-gated sodium channel [Albimonas donghaensis]